MFCFNMYFSIHIQDSQNLHEKFVCVGTFCCSFQREFNDGLFPKFLKKIINLWLHLIRHYVKSCTINL